MSKEIVIVDLNGWMCSICYFTKTFYFGIFSLFCAIKFLQIGNPQLGQKRGRSGTLVNLNGKCRPCKHISAAYTVAGKDFVPRRWNLGSATVGNVLDLIRWTEMSCVSIETISITTSGLYLESCTTVLQRGKWFHSECFILARKNKELVPWYD